MTHPNSLKNLKPFPPGVSGNAGRGRNHLPEELKGIKSLTQTEVVKLISKYARMTKAEILLITEDPNLSVLEASICSIFSKSIKIGDYTRLAFLLDRCIGKVPDMVQDEEYLQEREELKKLSMNELLSLVKTNISED